MAAKKNCIILSHRPFKILTVLTIDLDHFMLSYNTPCITMFQSSQRPRRAWDCCI